MLVSTRGRYALCVMIDLAEHDSGEYIVLADIAERQGISEKYLEGILAALSKKGFVRALRGRGGGYRLARAPESYTVMSVLELTEESLAPVDCLREERNRCVRREGCRTIAMWTELYGIIRGYLEGITISDLMRGNGGGDYVI